jgi:eukaryotic-like serine/threonine-protein kinase
MFSGRKRLLRRIIVLFAFMSLLLLAACQLFAVPTPSALPNDTFTPTIQPLPSPTLIPSPIPSQTAHYKVGSTKISPKDGMTLVYVPAGGFLMGASDSDTQASSDEKPHHNVYLDAFWIDQTDVTNSLYSKSVSAGCCLPPQLTKSYIRSNYYGNSQYADYPVIYVDWEQASSYCSWAGRRLPSEAEWEKAARGTDGRTYPWGEGIDKSKTNYASTIDDTTRVGIYPVGASPYGALDMSSIPKRTGL